MADDDLRQQARELYLAGDGAGIEAGSFTVDVTNVAAPNQTSQKTRLRAIHWYTTAAGVICADVHGEHAGSVALKVEPRPDGIWTARARGFLAVVFHEIKRLQSEEAARIAIATWWQRVKA